MEQGEFVEGVGDFAGRWVVALFGLGGDGDFAGRAAAFPFELNFYCVGGVAVLEFDVGVQNLLAVFHFYEFCLRLFGLAGIKRSWKGRIGVEAIHAIEDKKIFAGADVIELEFSVFALKTPKAGLGGIETFCPIEFDGRDLE